METEEGEGLQWEIERVEGSWVIEMEERKGSPIEMVVEQTQVEDEPRKSKREMGKDNWHDTFNREVYILSQH